MPKILLAEDDIDMRRFLVKALQNAGFDVMSYDNGLSARQLDAVHFRHDDVGEQELERLLAQALVRRQPVVIGHDVETGILQRLHQELAHVDIVFGKQDFGHEPLDPRRQAPGPLDLDKPGRG